MKWPKILRWLDSKIPGHDVAVLLSISQMELGVNHASPDLMLLSSVRKCRDWVVECGLHVSYEPPGKINSHLSLDRSLDRSIARSLDRSLDRSIARSIDRSIARSRDRSIARSVTPSLARSLGRSLGRSLARSLARSDTCARTSTNTSLPQKDIPPHSNRALL